MIGEISNVMFAFMLACVAFAVIGWTCLYHAALVSGETRMRQRRMAHDAAFVEWAKWTTVTVTTMAGYIYTRTLTELRDEPRVLVWAGPISVALFQGAPEDTEGDTNGLCGGPGHGPERPLPDEDGRQEPGLHPTGTESQDGPPGKALPA